jgi:hypothetical protein
MFVPEAKIKIKLGTIEFSIDSEQNWLSEHFLFTDIQVKELKNRVYPQL